MLNVELDETQGVVIPKMDIESLFRTLKIKGTEEERYVISKIEQGEYNDEASFIDRFGYKLRIDQLSTGCKAALCVLNCTEKIDLLECSNNAIDVILSTCKNGNVIIRDRDITIRDYSPTGTVDISMDGYRFSTIDRLNYYLFDERPFAPDMDREGIEYIK